MPALMRGGVRLRGNFGFIVLAVVVLSGSLHVSRAFAHPNGGTGRARTWKPEWTRHFNECFEKYGEPLAKSRPTDKRIFCSNGNPGLSENDYWLSIYIPIARAESGFDAAAVGRNGRKVPRGLFQMSGDDMTLYDCEGRDPVDARQAICCAIKIGSYWAERGRSYISSGKKGILAEFFQPIQTGSGGDGRGGRIDNSKLYRKVVASSNRLCRSAPATARPELGATGGLFSCVRPVEDEGIFWMWEKT